MKVESVLVTGANRGVGIEFVKQLTELPEPPAFIFATYRNPESLQDLKRIQEASVTSKVIFVKLDVNQLQDIEKARQVVENHVGEKGLTLLVNNAAFGNHESPPFMDPENLVYYFKTNAVGPIMMVKAFLPLLEKSAALCTNEAMSTSRAAVLNLSSMGGSIANTGIHIMPEKTISCYKISKAALNMAMRIIATNVKDKGILVVNMCPGWLKKQPGRHQTTYQESVSDMIDTMGKINSAHHGTFMDRLSCPYGY